MIRVLVFLMFGIAFAKAIPNGQISGKVVSVIDGNTIEVLGEDKSKYNIVLAGVDCPELTQDYGDKAKRFLEKLLLNKDVIVTFQGKDRKGNYVAIVMKDQLDPRIELLKEGLSWTSEKDPQPDLESYRINAQQKGRGLWKEANPTPPWIFRRQQSMMQPKSS